MYIHIHIRYPKDAKHQRILLKTINFGVNCSPCLALLSEDEQERFPLGATVKPDGLFLLLLL